MSTLTQDSRSAATLTADTRPAAATLTQDNRTQLSLWSASNSIWQMDYPWLWSNNGSLITSDIR